jgi:hypothetical protein
MVERRARLTKNPISSARVHCAALPFKVMFGCSRGSWSLSRDNFGTLERAEISLIFRTSDTGQSI